ncbi:cupredoxin domain-containing protein [Alicyclobacillus sp. SO9]|uniref:cupredoxin domain-containing protein n=1 Tax=Alicyclobacillus sp. SO9 TaxID=2665646 RepID=UPI0018E903F9|nr:cupredoxin domain-containing protein [Alicyclobacillus sp. SO9]QQE78274.1 cupredoxin domain-containing protein [Alicyclobacillus sp. SO9]
MKHKTSRWVYAGIATVLIGLSGCGTPSTTLQGGRGSMMGQSGAMMQGQSNSRMGQGASMMQGQQNSNGTSGSETSAGTSAASQSTAKNQHIYLTVLAGAKLGSDGKMHDIFSPADFVVHPDKPVTVTVYNYDTGEHSFTSQALGVNASVKGAQRKGVPSTTTFTFTPKETGTYTWACTVPCDDNAGGWAMSHDGFMAGKVSVVAD